MTFRATVRDGLIVINTHGELPDGTTVEVVRTANGTRARKSPAARKPQKKARTGGDPFLAILGMCKGRRDWKGKSGSSILASTRERSEAPHATSKAKRGSASAGKNRQRSRASKAGLSLGALKGRWAERPEWAETTSAVVAKSLRKKAMGRLG